MNDKDKIKFAISYLKKGLKSKRTPPLYEELMKELGFVKKDMDNDELKADLDSVTFYDKLSKAKEIIKSLCKMVRELNNPNVQLTNVDYSLAEAEQFIKE